MQLNPIASSIVVAFYLFSALALVVLIGMAAYALAKLNALLEAYQAKLDPLLTQAESVLTLTSAKLDSIGQKAESILTQGEEMTASVQDKVDKTATIVQRTVNAPVIGVNSVWAGVARGFATFGRLQRTAAPGKDAAITASISEERRPVAVPQAAGAATVYETDAAISV